MSFTTLISVLELQSLYRSGMPSLVVLDARFDLMRDQFGWSAFQEGHLPRAQYVHLERDLSAQKYTAEGVFKGRHPLPPRADWAEKVGQLGISPQTQVVLYDDQGGIFASRVWWMLRWLGHDAVAVLDGGLSAWTQSGVGFDVAQPAVISVAKAYPQDRRSLVSVVEADELQARLERPDSICLMDARAPERFRGDVEPLDAVAGHIPHALNRFFQLNLNEQGRFKAPDQLRSEFESLMQGRAPAQCVHQCGSGVTACHNLLAFEVAGISGAALYPGSWSEWCAALPSRPMVKSVAS